MGPGGVVRLPARRPRRGVRRPVRDGVRRRRRAAERPHSVARRWSWRSNFKHMDRQRGRAGRPLAGAASQSSRATYQQLPDADDFVGWGQQPYFTEYDSRGQRRCSTGGSSATPPATARTSSTGPGRPTTPPAVAARTAGQDHDRVHELERGDQRSARWRVLERCLADRAADRARAVLKQGFETAITIAAAQYVAVAGARRKRAAACDLGHR